MTDISLSTSTRLHGYLLAAARVIWVVVVLLSLFLFAFGWWDRFTTPLPTNCGEVVCNPVEFTGDDLAVMQSADLPAELFLILNRAMNLLFNLGFIVTALIMVWRKSDDWMVLLLSATLVILGGVAFSPANDVLFRTRPVLSPLVNLLPQPAYFALITLLLIFPDGRFVPRWSWVFTLPIVLLTFGMNLLSENLIESNTPLMVPIYLVFFLAVIIFQVYRYRRVSSPTQRQQTKWGLIGISGTFLIMIGWAILATNFPPEQPSMSRAVALLALWPVMTLLGIMVPVSLAIAILRYRLWDIDLIVRRTFQYTLLTGVLALVYFGAVVLLQQAFRVLTGRADSPVAVVISTLFIAALFNPLRARFQEFIDRRFDRLRYDAERVLVGFAHTTQQDVEMERLTGEIVGIIQKTVNPEHASIWFVSPPSEDEPG